VTGNIYPRENGEEFKMHVTEFQLAGLLVGRGKKVKFSGMFRDKYAEKTADFAGISREFSRPISLKSNR